MSDILEGFVIPEDFDLPEETQENVEETTPDEEEVITEVEEAEEPEETEEPEESDEEQPEEEEEQEEAEGNSEDSELFKTLAATLKEEGFFGNLDDLDKITDVNALADAFRKEIKANEYSDLNDTQKRVLEAFRTGVPAEDVIRHEQTAAQFNSIKEEDLVNNDELRKQIILSDLQAKGVSEKRAMLMYEAMYDKGEDIEEAKVSLDSLKEAEAKAFEQYVQERKAEAEKQKQAKLEEFNKLKSSIEETDKFLGETPISETMRENVLKAMSVPVTYLDDGTPVNKLMKARMDDPVAFEKNLYYLFELTNGFKDLKLITKKVNSKVSKKLSETIKNSTYVKDSGVAAYKKDPESYSSPIVKLLD